MTWIRVHASFRYCVSYAVIETGIFEKPSIYYGKDVFVLLPMLETSVLLAGAIPFFWTIQTETCVGSQLKLTSSLVLAVSLLMIDQPA